MICPCCGADIYLLFAAIDDTRIQNALAPMSVSCSACGETAHALMKRDQWGQWQVIEESVSNLPVIAGRDNPALITRAAP